MFFIPNQIQRRVSAYSKDELRYVLNQIDNEDAFERAATDGKVTALEFESLNMNLTSCGVPVSKPVSEKDVRCACKALHERERELR